MKDLWIKYEKERFGFWQFVIIVALLFEPSLKAFSLIILDVNKLSILGAFKIWDLPVLLLFLNILVSERRKHVEHIFIFKNIISFWFAFLIFYNLYTAFLVDTSSLLGAFKYSRAMLYLGMYFVFPYYITSKKVFNKFFIFFRIANIVVITTYFLTYIFPFEIVPFGPTDAYGYMVRLFWGNPLYILLILNMGLVSYLIKYNRSKWFTNIELGISIFLIFVTLSRNLWVASIISVIIVILLGGFKVYKHIQLKGQLKFLLVLVLLGIISVYVLYSSGYSTVFFDRILFAEQDLSEGKGTFSTRLYQFDKWFYFNKAMGLEYTGLGFPHSTSDFIRSKSYWMESAESWGAESSIMQGIINWGYIGFGVFALIYLLLLRSIMKTIKKVENKFVFVFGLSIALVFFVSLTGLAFSGTIFESLIPFAFIIAMFERAHYFYEVKGNKEDI